VNNADYTRYRVRPGKAFSLRDVNPEDTQGHPGKKRARKQLRANLERLSTLQERLYAESEGSVLIVVQAMDGGGKDSTIRRVFRGINPQGSYVVNFKAPTPEELAHTHYLALNFLSSWALRGPSRPVVSVGCCDPYRAKVARSCAEGGRSLCCLSRIKRYVKKAM